MLPYVYLAIGLITTLLAIRSDKTWDEKRRKPTSFGFVLGVFAVLIFGLGFYDEIQTSKERDRANRFVSVRLLNELIDIAEGAWMQGPARKMFCTHNCRSVLLRTLSELDSLDRLTTRHSPHIPANLLDRLETVIEFGQYADLNREKARNWTVLFQATCNAVLTIQAATTTYPRCAEQGMTQGFPPFTKSPMPDIHMEIDRE